MTPERAAELADDLRFKYAMSNAARAAIQQAILAACKEQKEACIKIAEDYAKNAGNMYARRSGRSVADRIRSAE